MPTGKVRFYDEEKGFGFLSSDEGEDVYVHASVLPAGVKTLSRGARVEFDIAQGRRGDQALHVRLLEPAPSVSRTAKRCVSPGAFSGDSGSTAARRLTAV